MPFADISCLVSIGFKYITPAACILWKFYSIRSEITRDLAGLSNDVLKDLDENGIIRIGAEVRAGEDTG